MENTNAETIKLLFEQNAVEAALELAAANGLLLLRDEAGEMYIGKAACAIYDVKSLLLPYIGQSKFAPDWISYNREKDFPMLASMGTLCNAFISYCKLTKKKGAFYADGEAISADTIREKLLACLSIVSKEPAKRLEGAEKQLMVMVKETKNEQTEEEARQEHLQASAAGYIDGFFAQIKANKATPAIQTGFSSLDKILDGGLHAGLYIVGALTSLGKTTFTLQAADQMAKAGHDVLFFSLEMSRTELIAKSLSRYTYEISKREGMSQDKAKTTRGILSGRWENYSREEMELMAKATDEYKEGIASRIWFYEGVGNIGVIQIREEVEKHIKITGRLPVVVIDYLQILAPVDIRASDKQNTDKNVLELKRLSRDKGIPVFGISSLNRDNYTAPINAAAFKESGAIEYSSDVLLGLQFAGMDYDEGETDKAREKRIRELIKDQKEKGNAGGAETIELKILKNRNGKSGAAILFFYTPMFNHYEPMQEGFQRTPTADNIFSSSKPKKKPL